MEQELTNFLGIWSFASEVPEGLEYLEITPTRVLQAVIDRQKPGRRMPLSLWHEIVAPDVWRLWPRPGSEGWQCGFWLDGDTLVITNGQAEFRCSRVPEEAVPEWLREHLRVCHAKMDEMELAFAADKKQSGT